MLNRHDQVTAIAGGIEVVDLEGPRGHRSLQDGDAVLRDDHAGVGVRNAAHNRRKIATGIRQHLVAARQ
jgi:hypothetical protein